MGDLVVQLPEPVTETILRCELPHICDLRPHEDPRVEAWLLRWVDGEGGDGPLIVQALTLATLQVLTSEQPEVCPLFCTQLGRFEKALDRWLLDWPAAEPWRAALPASARGGPTAEVLELELHAALALLRAGPPAPVQPAAARRFHDVAMGWVLKLHCLYGLEMQSQPGRVAEPAGNPAAHMSLLRWEPEQVIELLRCPFYRPPEPCLLAFARTWWAEAAMPREKAAAVEAAVSAALLWELLPAPEDDERPFAPPAEAARGSGAARVPGASFQLVERRDDCPTAAFAGLEGLRLEEQPSLACWRCWSECREEQVVGASRQVLASRLPMSPRGGAFRLDFRVTGGTQAEEAHLLEVGLMADPGAGVCFVPGGPGAGRPAAPCEAGGLDQPFFRLVAVLDTLLEGVRLSVEVDFDERVARVRNLPAVAGHDRAQGPTPLGAWLAARAKVCAVRARPPNERDCKLFREEAAHLQDLIDRGRLAGELAGSVLGDEGARVACDPSAAVQGAPEDYHFYVVVPPGLELELF